MDEKLRQLLDQMPERPPRSKLEPHLDVIRELRRKRRTYQEISAFLREHLQLSVAPSTIHDFVKTRAKQARNRNAVALELPPEQATETNVVSAGTSGPANADRGTVRDRIRALKAESTVPDSAPQRFVFDPQQPLTLDPKPKEK